MPQMIAMQLDSIKIESQVRKFFDEEELRRLGENIKSYGLLQPLLVRKDGVLLAGERRYRAMQLMGIKEAQVIVTEKVLSDSEVWLIQLAENLHRSDISGYEKWYGCTELMNMNPGWQMKDLARALSLDPSMVTRLLSPGKCVEAAQAALRDRKISISDCYALSKLDPSEQPALLAMKLAGASRDQIEQAGRKRRNGTVPAIRMSRVKIPMPRATLVISGKELSMAEVVELLAETLKEAKKAAAQFDVKTFQSMMSDKARV
jgi:ParB family chromosome partitioning protein